MKKEIFLLSVVKKIESLKEGVICYAYKTGNESMNNAWWEVSISDFDLYQKDSRLKALSNAWRKAANSQGFKIVFVCGWSPTEKRLVDLAEKDNLILNI